MLFFTLFIATPIILLLVYRYLKPTSVKCYGCIDDGLFYKCNNRAEINRTCAQMKIGKEIRDQISSKINGLYDELDKTKREISGPIQNVLSKLNQIKSLANNITNPISSVLGELDKIIDMIPEFDCGVGGVNPCKDLRDLFIMTIRDVIHVLKKYLFNPFIQIISDLISHIKNYFNDLFSPITTTVNVLKGEITNITSSFKLVNDNVSEIKDSITGLFDIGVINILQQFYIDALISYIPGGELMIYFVRKLPIILLIMLIVGGAAGLLMLPFVFLSYFV
jgi:phage-related minor tail protein